MRGRRLSRKAILIIVAVAAIFAVRSLYFAIAIDNHMVSNCGMDENGCFSGGKAGDQNGKEWYIRSWPDMPWTCVLRYPDAGVRAEIARLARQSADNDMIGYDQRQRLSYWDQLEASGYNPARISVPCETDCSSGVASIVKAVGYRKGIKALKNTDIRICTGTMRASLAAEGFKVLDDAKYLRSPAYLLPGDIILCENRHVVINLSQGWKAA